MKCDLHETEYLKKEEEVERKKNSLDCTARPKFSNSDFYLFLYLVIWDDSA